MLFKLYLDNEPVMEKVLFAKANPIGVAVKDDNGVTRVFDGCYVAEVDGLRGFIALRSARPAGQAP